MQLLRNKYFILFLSVCEFIQVQLVGTMSLADLVIMACMAYMLLAGYVSAYCSRDKDIAHILILYVVLFAVQTYSEFAVGNSTVNMMKGLAVTVLSAIKFLFYWIIVGKRPRLIFWLLGGMSISALLFGKTFGDEGNEAEAVLYGWSLVYFKFKIAPFFGMILVCISLMRNRWTVLLYWAFIVIGVFCIILGARSTGLMIFLTGVLYVFIKRTHTLSKIAKVSISTVGVLVLYGIFALYVSAVLSGTIKSGNSADQLKKIENPYNPIYALLSGRTESPASLAAIYDSPLYGHGAWAEDPGFKYHLIAAHFAGTDREKHVLQEMNVIPSHSVILGYGVNEGIFAMLFVSIIIGFFILRGLSSCNIRNPLIYVVLYSVMQLIWDGLFSPVSHFRLMFPIYFVCCLYSYKYMQWKRWKHSRTRSSKIIKNHEKVNMLCHNR